MTPDKEGKFGKVVLMRDFFGHVSVEEFKALTDQDRTELASACAKELLIPASELSFTPVEY